MPVSQFLQNTTLKAIICEHCGSGISSAVLDAPIEAVRSCELPTEREAAELQSGCAADEKGIAAFDAAIARAQAIVDDMRKQRRFLRKNWGRKRALLAPIRRLPTEILAQIISLAVMRTFRRHRDFTVIIRHPVLQVCQRWRNLAIQMPELAYPHCTYGGWAKDISDCLARSKDLPLELEIRYGHSPWHAYFPPHVRRRSSWSCDTMHQRAKSDDLVRMLLDVAPRWRSLCILDTSMPEAFFLAQPHLPLLQSLALSHDIGRSAIADTHAPIPLFSDAPNLARVTLRIPYSSFLQLQLPWARLTHLELEVWGITAQASMLNILDQCKALTSLHFSIINYQIDCTKGPLVALPHLRSLELTAMGFLLLHVLKAPCLQEIQHLGPSEDLGIYGSPQEYFQDSAPLVAFAIQSGAVSLEVLSLVIAYWGSGESDYGTLWIHGLRYYPSLRCLTVSNSYWFRVTEALRALLVALTRMPDLLPHLERLSLPTLVVGGEDSDDEVVYTLEELMEFIATRSAVLKEVEVKTVRSEDDPFARCSRFSVDLYMRDSHPLRHAKAEEEEASSDEEYSAGIEGEWDEV